jgi:hypothetical protein
VNGSDWTCARCGVTVRFVPGALNLSEMPASWDEVNGIAYCLSCRRKMAGEEKAAALAEEEPIADLVRADAEDAWNSSSSARPTAATPGLRAPAAPT